MSSDRTIHRPLKPTLASNRTVRAPLAPRLGSNTTPSPSIRAAAPRVVARTPVVSPRLSQQDDGSLKDSVGSSNITPRSTARKLRVESAQSSPAQDDTSVAGRPRTLMTSSSAPPERGLQAGGLSVNGITQNHSRAARPASYVSDSGSGKSMSVLPRSVGYLDGKHSQSDDGVDNHFFHASDIQKQEPVLKRPEVKKPPAFFYADGREDRPPLARALSPVIPSASEDHSPSIKMRLDASLDNTARGSPAISPALSSIAATSPYFANIHAPLSHQRPPSPSKENIHLSYRKGASQIFGVRPAPRSVVSLAADMPTMRTAATLSTDVQQRPGFTGQHRKSSSVSSIDSGNSHQARRRSATTVDLVASAPTENNTQPVVHVPRISNPSLFLPSIDTSLADLVDSTSPLERIPSPTKAVSELAAEARRERKVLDLEISNNSLLAINASLEREVRRQKAELKRFRRLSRAGRFSFDTNERLARFSEGLSTLGEDQDDDEDTLDESLPGFAEDYSDSEDEGSVTSTAEPLSPNTESHKHQERLAKDEKRLRVDLARHKELLVQSQMMNQSLKRCMYATEEMIKEGKKALQYHVRVSDVKLGGRVLTGVEDEDEQVEIDIEVVDDDDTLSHAQESMESANALLDVWKGVGRPSFDGSEASGDRDSGIEVDKPVTHVSLGHPGVMIPMEQPRYDETVLASQTQPNIDQQ